MRKVSDKRKTRNENIDKKVSDKLCPRCDKLMQRRKHKEILDFLKKQPFYYSEWDYCRPCKFIQHYQEYLIINYKKI